MKKKREKKKGEGAGFYAAYRSHFPFPDLRGSSRAYFELYTIHLKPFTSLRNKQCYHALLILDREAEGKGPQA